MYVYIYHINQPNVGQYTSPMDPQGFKDPNCRPVATPGDFTVLEGDSTFKVHPDAAVESIVNVDYGMYFSRPPPKKRVAFVSSTFIRNHSLLSVIRKGPGVGEPNSSWSWMKPCTYSLT